MSEKVVPLVRPVPRGMVEDWVLGDYVSNVLQGFGVLPLMAPNTKVGEVPTDKGSHT